MDLLLPTCITLKLVKRFLLSKMIKRRRRKEPLYLLRIFNKATGKIDRVIEHKEYAEAVKDNKFYNSTENLKSDIVIL